MFHLWKVDKISAAGEIKRQDSISLFVCFCFHFKYAQVSSQTCLSFTNAAADVPLSLYTGPLQCFGDILYCVKKCVECTLMVNHHNNIIMMIQYDFPLTDWSCLCLEDTFTYLVTGWQRQSTGPRVQLRPETGNDLSPGPSSLRTANSLWGQRLIERHSSFVITEQDAVLQ